MNVLQKFLHKENDFKENIFINSVDKFSLL